MIDEQALNLLTLCATRIEGKSLDWSLLARCAAAGHLPQLMTGHIPEQSQAARRSLPLLRLALEDTSEAQSRVYAELEEAEALEASLFTVLDEHYPPNLREVPDLPPFLFVRGELTPADARAVAVVGTRQASAEGLSRASRMARELVAEGVTVVSGLAKGVDTAAHTAALDTGGRTIAVLGTGLTKCYPAENRALAERIVEQGALVSQFWPTRPPGRDTFPRRNRVTSGLSQGSVVIEASRTSGAKLQARLAYEHGKRVWLIRSLVTSQDWARQMVEAGKATEVASTTEVIKDLRDDVSGPYAGRPVVVDEQLSLDL